MRIFAGEWVKNVLTRLGMQDGEAIESRMVTRRVEAAQKKVEERNFEIRKNLLEYDEVMDDQRKRVYGFRQKILDGEPCRELILDMIEANAFGLKDAAIELVESSEQGMLAQVAKEDQAQKAIIFLGWEPHPMNANFKMTYLTGGDDFFGPNLGGATVYTNTRAGYATECPNTGKFLSNLVFSLAMENEIMGAILNDGTDPAVAAKTWLAAHPDVITPWLAGVTTKDGGDAVAAVTAALK
jgi:glycine betaine/proline transport system substrate-binding protein